MMELDDLIHVYITGMSADDLRNAVAASGYRSIMSELYRNQGPSIGGGKGSHDDSMIWLADRMPGRYAPQVIDDIKQGFHQLKAANVQRYCVVIINHTDGGKRAQKAELLGLSERRFKTELELAEAFLKIRFHDYMYNKKSFA